MPTNPIDTTAYGRVLLIDSQVVLETRPLEQLPWIEITTEPILLLVCRQVQSEIDAKKRDGRLGKRSRTFNNLLDKFLETRAPVRLSNGPPVVDIALVSHRGIDWSKLDALDPTEGDDKIVAQALHAAVDDPKRVEVFSHDLRPRDAAILYGLSAAKLPDHWLLEPEPSAHEKKLIELREEVRLLSESQPKIAVSIEPLEELPVARLVVEQPTADQIEVVRQVLMRDTRRPSPPSFMDPLGDTSHGSRWDQWAKRLQERDLPLMHSGLSRIFSQHIIQVRIENIGAVAAAQLSVELSSGNTTLHSRPFLVDVLAPAPRPRSRLYDPTRYMPTFQDLVNRDPFAFSTDVGGPGELIRYVCADFRQGRVHLLQLAVELEERTGEKAQIEARVTCSNMNGATTERRMMPVKVRNVEFADMVGRDKPLLKASPAVFDVIENDDDVPIFRNDGSRRKN